MRALALAVALVGCYRPSDPACSIACTIGDPSTCPSGLACGAASYCEASGQNCNGILDARNDGAPESDGSTTGACNEFPTEAEVVAGGEYTTNAQRTRASILDGDIYVNDNEVDAPSRSSYVVAVSTPSIANEIYGGRLDPTGDLLYFATDVMTTSTSRIYVARRTGANTWQPPETVVLVRGTDVTLPEGTTVGASTHPMFGRRLLPIRIGTGFDEYIETSTGAVTQFEYKATYEPADLGVATLRAASFTATGLRVVFDGEVGQVSGIFVAERANANGPFGPAVLLRKNLESSVDTAPFLSADCKHLYWSRLGVAYHAVGIR